MRRILLFVLVALMAAPLAMAQRAFELKLAHADSTDMSVSRKHAQAVAFADLVNTRSGGRIDRIRHSRRSWCAARLKSRMPVVCVIISSVKRETTGN